MSHRLRVPRTLRRNLALLLLTLAVVVVPNVVAFAASVLLSEAGRAQDHEYGKASMATTGIH